MRQRLVTFQMFFGVKIFLTSGTLEPILDNLLQVSPPRMGYETSSVEKSVRTKIALDFQLIFLRTSVFTMILDLMTSQLLLRRQVIEAEIAQQPEANF